MDPSVHHVWGKALAKIRQMGHHDGGNEGIHHLPPVAFSPGVRCPTFSGIAMLHRVCSCYAPTQWERMV
jgi:hypothetical protein